MKYISSSVSLICNIRHNYILQYKDTFMFLVHEPLPMQEEDVAICLWRIKWKQ